MSFLSRIAVAAFLFALALGLERYFVSVEQAIQAELDTLGLNRIVLSQNQYGDQLGSLRGGLDELMHSFAPDPASHLYLRRVPQVAEVELVGRRPIYGYRDNQLAALQQLFPEITEPGAYLVDPAVPSGTRVRALIADLDLNLNAIRESLFGLDVLGTESLALLPSAWIPWLEESGFAEIVIYQSPYQNPLELQAELDRLHTLLQLEGLGDVEIRSGFALLQRLESIREQHAIWSLLIELFVGLLIIFVFASTGFLEYRQNAYLSALLQSLGVARALLALRYLAENLILLFAAFAVAFALIALAMNGQLPFLTQSSLEPLALDSLRTAVQTWFPLILITAVASFIPIGLGLRREVGSILQ